MKLLRVSYRAVFRHLRGGFRTSANIDVELVEHKKMWSAVAPDSGADFGFHKMPDPESAKKEAASHFEEMVSDGWWIVAMPPDESQKRVLEPDEYELKDGKVYWPEIDDRTHIVFPGEEDPKEYRAACGGFPKLKNFISLKANIPPSCKRCAEIYEERYAKK